MSHSLSKPHQRAIALVLTVAMAMIAGHSAQAAIKTWNNAGTAWATAGDWTGGAPTNDLTTDTALFNSTLFNNQPNYGTTSVNGIQVGDGITATGALNLTGTALSLGSGGFTIAANAGPVSLGGTTVTIGASQNWANSSSSLFTVGAAINGGAFTLTLNSTGSGGTALTGIIGGASQAVTVNTTGSGVTTLSGANTYAGATTLTAGILRATTNAGALGAGTLSLGGGELQLANASGSNLSFNRNTTVTASMQITSDVTAAGAGDTFTLGTLSIGNQQLNIRAGNNVTGGIAGVTFGATTLTNTAIFDMAANTNLTLGALTGNFNFTQQNSGQLTLNTASARSAGGTTLSGGTLRLGSTSALGTTATTLTLGTASTLNVGTLDLATDSSISAYATTVAAPVTILSDRATGGVGVTHTLGTLSIGAFTLSVAGGSNVTSGTAGLTFGATTLTGGSTFNITKPANGGTTLLTVGAITDGGNQLTLTGAGNFAQSAAWAAGSGGGLTLGSGYTGTATLSQSNLYTGGTTINGGTLTLGNTNGLGSTTAAYVAFGASSTGKLQLNGNNATIVGLNTNATAGTPVIENGHASTAATLTINNASANTYAGVLQNGAAATLGLTKNGAGTLTLSGTNTYTGITTLGGGTLALGSSGAIGGGGTITFLGGTLQFGASNNTLAATRIVSSAGVISLDTNGQSVTFGAALANTNTGGLVKLGAGTLILSAADLYTGTTTVSGGTLQLGGAGTLASLLLAPATGGSFVVDNTTAAGGNSNARISDSAALQLNGGSFIYKGADAASTNSTETIGPITGSGGSTVTLVAGGANTAVLTAASFGHTAGNGSILVNGVSLGANTTAVNRFISTAAPTLTGTTTPTNSINAAAKDTKIVPFLVGEATATTGGLGTATGTANTFVTYAATSGFRPLNLADEFTNNAITTGNNTTITSPTTAAGTASINSLILNGGNLAINDGVTLTNTSGALLFSGTNSINPAGTTGILAFSAEGMVTVNSGVTGTITAVVSGPALTKGGAGTLVLSGANTTSGATTLTSGILRATTSANALGAGTLSLGGGELQLANASGSNLNFGLATTVTGNAKITSDLTASGAGDTFTLGTLSIGAQTLSVAGGTNVTSGTAGLAFGATTLSANGAIFDTAAGTNLTLGALAGNFNFTKQNGGQLTLNTASARSAGVTTLSGGTLRLGSTAALGSTGTTLTLSGGTLDLATDASINAYATTVAGSATIASDKATTASAGTTHTLGTLSIGAQTLTVAGGANVTSGTAGLAFGATTLTGGATFNITNPSGGGVTLLTLGAITDGGNRLTLTGAGNFAQSAAWAAGSGGLTLGSSFSGTATLNQANLYTGGTIINGGTLALGNATGLGAATVASVTFGAGSTGKLQLGGFNPTIVGLNTNATVGTPVVENGNASTPAILAVNTASASTYGGTLQDGGGSLTGGTLGLTMTGTGVLALSGASTYTGATTINAGTISVGGTLGSVASASSSLGAGSNTLNLGNAGVAGTLAYTGAGETTDRVITLGGTTGGGVLDQSGTGLLKFTGNLTAVNITAKTLTLQGSTAGTGEFAGIISNSPPASTTAGADFALGDTTITVASVANLAAGQAITGTGIAPGTTIASIAGTTLTLSTVAAGAGTSGEALSFTSPLSVTKAGTGTWTLSGANTYTGTTTLNGGTLITNTNGLNGSVSTGAIVFNGGTLQPTSAGIITGQAVTMTGGGTINTVGVNDNVTLNGTISGTGILVKNGLGSLTLAGNNTSTNGGVALNAGTLNINGFSYGFGTNGSLTINGGSLDNTSGGFVSMADPTVILNADFTFAGSQTLSLGAGLVSLGTTAGTTRTITTNGGINQGLIIGGTISNGATVTALTKTGSGALTLSGNNTYSGLTTLSNGFLTLSGANTGAGGVEVDGGTLTINNTMALGTGTLTLNGGIIDALSALTVNNASVWNANFFFVGSSNLGLGAVSLGTAAGTSRTLTIAANTLTVNGVIANGNTATALIETGAGNLTLNAANTFTGGLTFGNGTLAFTNPAAFGPGVLTINDATLLDNTTNVIATTNSGVVINGNFSTTGRFASLTLGTGTGTYNLGTAAGTARTISPGGASGNVLAINGNIANGTTATGIIMAGSGSLSLGGNNTFTGGVILNSGTLNINSGRALGTGTLTINGGTIGNTSGWAVTLANNNAQIWNADFSTNVISTATALNLGTGTISLGSTSTDTTRTINAGVNTNGTLTVGGSIQNGTGNVTTGLTKIGLTTLLLAGNNTYTGTTTITNTTAGFTGLTNFTGVNSGGGAVVVTGNMDTGAAATMNVAGGSGSFTATTSYTVTGGGTLNVGDIAAANGLANRLNPAGTLIMGGGDGAGFFNLMRGSTTANSQSLNSLTIGAGGNSIGNGGSGGGIPTLTFSGANPYVRNAGGFVNFFTANMPVTFTSSPSGAGNVASGLLIGGVLNFIDFIKAQSGGLTATSYTSDTWSSGNNTTVTVSSSPGTSVTTGSLRFNAAGSQTLTLAGTNTLQSGGIIVGTSATAGTASGTITGGSLQAGVAGGDLWIYINNGKGLTINSVIANNSGSSLSVAAAAGGLATLTLTGLNTYTGNTTIGSGATLALNNNTGQTLYNVDGGGIVQNNNTSGSITLNQTNSGLSLSTVGGVSGSTIVFTGTGNTTMKSTLASPGQNVQFTGGTATVVNNNGSGVTTSNLAVNGGTLNFSTPLTMTNVTSGTQTLAISSGQINVAGNGVLRTNAASSGFTGTQTGGVFTSTGTLTLGNQSGGATVTGTGTTYNLSGGSLSLGALTIAADPGANSATTFNLSGGKLVESGTIQGANGATKITAQLTTNGTTTATVSNASGLAVGQAVDDGLTNIAAGTFISAIAGTTLTLSTAATGSGTNQTTNFSNRVMQAFVWTGGTLAAGTYNATNLTSTAGALVVSGVGATNTLVNGGGTLAAGDIGATGKTTITGNYTVTSPNAAFDVDIGGGVASTAAQNAPGTGFYDQVAIVAAGTGTGSAATIGGKLNARLLDGYDGVSGGTGYFTILTATGGISGTFTNTAPSSDGGVRTVMPNGLASLTVSYYTNSIVLGSYQTDNYWLGDGSPSTNWSNQFLWLNFVPSLAGHVAKFNDGASFVGAQSVVLDANETVGSIVFDSGLNGNQFTIAPDSPNTGKTLTLDNNGAAAAISVLSGNHAIDVPVALAGNLVVTTTGAGDSLEMGGTISGTGMTLTQTGAGTLILSGNNTYTGATTVSSGTLQIGNGGTSGMVAGNIINNSQLVFNRSDSLAFAAVISGSGSVSQIGTGVLTLSGANTYAGATSISGNGTLSIASIGTTGGASSNLGAGANTINLGATTTSGALLYTGAGETTARAINLAGATGGGTIDQSGTGLLKFTGNLTATGGGAKTLILQGSTAGTGEIAGAIVDNSVANPTSLAKAGTSTWTLSGANTYTGGTAVNAGQLTSKVAGALGSTSGALTLGGGTLDLNALNQTVGAVSITAAAGGNTIQNGTLTGASFAASNGAGNAIISANLAGGGATLTMTGAGTLTLTGANTYTGGTTVSAGTLATGATGTFGTGNLTLLAGTTLILGNSTSMANTSSLFFDATATVNLSFTGTEFLGGVQQTGGAALLAGSYNASQLNTFFGSTAFSGTGSFSIAAIPEPSAYALLAALCAGLCVAVRRRHPRP